MATQPAAYRNSDDFKSAKSAPPRPSLLVSRIECSRLPARLRNSAKYFILASKHGPDLYASTFKAAKMAEVSYRTMQRHLDWLEHKRVFQQKYEANKFYQPGRGIRRTATYVLAEGAQDWLAPRETYEQWERRNKRKSPPRRRPRHTQAPEPPAPPPAAPAPVLVRPTEVPVHRGTAREPNRRERQEMAAKVAVVRKLMKGYAGQQTGSQGLYYVGPDNPDYREPLSLDAAITEACMQNPVVPEKKVREWLKLLPRSLDEESP